MGLNSLLIFTPTYNRNERIISLYETILDNVKTLTSGYKVVWLIVDDGSKCSYDNLLSLTKANKNKNLEVRYVKKENGGKHSAFNYAIEHNDCDLFVCIDDDDKLLPHALEDIFKLANQFKGANYGAIVGRVVDLNNNVLGKNVFKDTIMSNTIEIRDKYHFWGEPEIYYSNVLKNYRFDIFKNEKFLTEAYLFDKMSVEHPFVYTNVPMMKKEYLEGGLTANALKIRVDNPLGSVTYYFNRQKMSKGLARLKARLNKLRFNYWLNKEEKVKKSFVDIFVSPLAYLMYKKDERSMKR